MASFQELYETGLLTDEFVTKLVAKGNKQLFADAVTANNLEVVKLFVEKGFDDLKNDNIGFKTALKTLNIEMLKYFQQIGFYDVKVANNHLSDAVLNGNLALTKFIIESGGNDQNYDHPVKYASSNGHLEVVKLLVEYGANITVQNNYCVLQASYYGYLDLVKFLIEKGADVKANNNWAIRYASKNDHLEVVKLLIEHGADVKSGLDFNPSAKVKHYLLTLTNVSYYGIMTDNQLEIKLPNLEEIVKDNKYYYVYKCQNINGGYVVTDQINRYNILSSFGQVMYFNKI